MISMTEKNLEKLKTKKAIRSRSPNKILQKQTKSQDIQKLISLRKRKEFPKRLKTQKPKEKEKKATRKGKKERNDMFVVS